MNPIVQVGYRFKIKIIKRKLKNKVDEFFLMKNSLNHLMKYFKVFYSISIDFEEIFLESKNPKRFKICILNCIMFWMVTFLMLLFLISDKLYSLIDGPFLPEHFKTFLLLIIVLIFMHTVPKTDLLIGEINYNLSSLKILYYLMNNLKSKHKLNYENYKKLAILSRLTQIGILDYGAPIICFGSFLFLLKITILSTKTIWKFAFLFVTPTLMISPFTGAPMICIIITIFTYYKLLFEQINDKIKLISKEKLKILNKKVFKKIMNRRNENQLMKLIDEHNEASIEIYKINLFLRKSIGCGFISFSFLKIISLFMVITNFDDDLMNILTLNIFILSSVFGWGMSYLFSQQIKSAHKSYKSIHSIVCNYKMRLTLKLKVS